MKNLLALALTAVLFLTGCATTGGINQAKIVPLVHAAAFTGTTAYLSQDPGSRTQFVEAVAALGLLLHGDTLTLEQIRSALATLPVKELRDEKVAIAIKAAFVVTDVYGADIADLPALERVQALKPIAQAIRDGIQSALSFK